MVGEDPDIQRIPAHSWILSKNSPVFRAMFKRPLGPQTTTPTRTPSPTTTKRQRNNSATSDCSKYVGSSNLCTITDNEDSEEDYEDKDDADKPIEFDAKVTVETTVDPEKQQPPEVTESGRDEPSCPAPPPVKVPIIVIDEVTTDDEDDDMKSSTASVRSTFRLPTPAIGLQPGLVSKATIAVSDVDGRAFDILLR